MTKVLDLTAIFERDNVILPDGTTVELRNPQELGVVKEHELRSLIARSDALQEKIQTGDPTDDDIKSAAELLQNIATALIVDLDREVPDWACVAIFRHWMEKATEEAEKNLAELKRLGVPVGDPRSPRTTAASSRGSKRSTAATRKRGSTSRRGR